MRKRKLVLLVDDSLLILRMASAFLVREYEVIAAGSGDGALAQAAAQKPDLIVMDLNMPGRSGVETARLLREEPQSRDIPIIIMTTESELARVPPDIDYLIKPFDGPTLLSKAASCLASTKRRTSR